MGYTHRLKKVLARSPLLRKGYHAARHLLGVSYEKRYHPISYEQWIKQGEPQVWVQPQKFTRNPLISVVVPTYNTPDKYLNPLVDSLRGQLYENWELVLADGSSNPTRTAAIKAICQQDDRLCYLHIGKKTQGIVTNTNVGIEAAKGEFVGFADHDDTLSPHALLEVVAALNKAPDTDFFYSDEDKISDDGKHRSHPFFKPDWSSTLLESVNYITHFSVVRRSLLKKVGVLRKGFDGAQDYDLILRITDHTSRIVHIPKILYHWRLAEGSTSGHIENKSYANDAGMRALADHVARKKIPAKVLPIPELPTNYRLQYTVPKDAKASIIIPFKDKVELLQKNVESILSKTTYKQYELILITNNSTEQATHDYLATLKDHHNIKIFEHNIPFNFSALNNFGRSKASGNYLVLLNNDTEVINGEWLSELLGVASQPWAGAVGPLLLYPNNTIQHAGIIMGMGTMAGHVWRHLPEDALTPFGRPYWPRNYLAVTAACLAIKTATYDEVGGLDETFVMAGQDVSFCLRLHEKGYLNTYWPFAKLYHYENVSVGSYSKAPTTDYDHSLTYYRPYLLWHDPYFNPNLSLRIEQVAYREDYSGEFN
jgi:glycosyltransferase involved in cell wall biosynthesis